MFRKIHNYRAQEMLYYFTRFPFLKKIASYKHSGALIYTIHLSIKCLNINFNFLNNKYTFVFSKAFSHLLYPLILQNSEKGIHVYNNYFAN